MSHMIEGKIALDTSVLGASWHGLENINDGAMTVEKALELSGANWTVNQSEVLVNGQIVPGYKANVRSSDNVVLGFVSDVYKPIQNSAAFNFVDAIIGGGDAKIHSAGVLYNKYHRPTRIFVTAQLKPITLMGDKIDNYLVFSHSHDGLNAVKAFVSPVRVVCHNTLTLATDQIEKGNKTSTPKRYWSTKHTGDIESKLQTAQSTLKLYEEYMTVFPVIAEGMNQINLYDEEILQVLDSLFPDDGTSGKSRLSQNACTMRDEILKVYNQKDDIARFRGTAWGFYQAITDVIEHITPFRNTSTAQVNREFQIVEGHPVTMRAQKMLMSIRK